MQESTQHGLTDMDALQFLLYNLHSCATHQLELQYYYMWFRLQSSLKQIIEGVSAQIPLEQSKWTIDKQLMETYRQQWEPHQTLLREFEDMKNLVTDHTITLL